VAALSIEVEKKPVEYRASCGASSCAVVVLIVKIYRERLCLTVLGAVEPTLYPGDVPPPVLMGIFASRLALHSILIFEQAPVRHVSSLGYLSKWFAGQPLQ
jgi:hypothetical protein